MAAIMRAMAATMRATAERLMAEMHKKQEMHDRVMAAAQERVEHRQENCMHDYRGQEEDAQKQHLYVVEASKNENAGLSLR